MKIRKNMEEDKMENNYQEYVTFEITTKDGTKVEMAVVDEFDFEKEHYVVGAIIEGDTINDDGRYIYRSVMSGEDFTVVSTGQCRCRRGFVCITARDTSARPSCVASARLS